MRKVLDRFIILAAAALLMSAALPTAGEEITVAAAADLNHPFNELGKLFTQKTGQRVRLSFGSSGLLAKQIEQGAPFDVFAAADLGFVEQVEKKGLIIPGTKQLYAQGHLVLWQRKDVGTQVNSLADLLKPEVKRIAIANPEHAPYGRAAQQALESQRLWDQLKSKIVYGENISQTLQFASSGNVDAAIVALSISRNTQGRYVLIDEKLHKPIQQWLAILRRTKHEHAARQFVAFITGPDGRRVLERYGFTWPGKTTKS
jgi:molybdate transport system substrate-binding protein